MASLLPLAVPAERWRQYPAGTERSVEGVLCAFTPAACLAVTGVRATASYRMPACLAAWQDLGPFSHLATMP
jgi:hypothetical protein